MYPFKRLILGGASSIFGFEEIKSIFKDARKDVCFIETPEMMQYNNVNDECIMMQDFCSMEEGDLFIPLNEFWLTYGHTHKFEKICERAYCASRSKRYLSALMMHSGISYCNWLTLSEAIQRIEIGKKILIKPDSYYSGHGVKIVQKANADRIEKYFKDANELDSRAERVLNIERGKAEIWEYISGEEYSADVFLCNGHLYVMRVCKKKIVVINDTPCVLAYVMIPVSDELYAVIKTWTDILFDTEDVSFGQFDFIERESGAGYVPIDFSCRIGGGLENLLMKCKDNVYGAALKMLLGEDSQNIYPDTGLYQFNILPTKCGEIFSDPYFLEIEDAIVIKNERKRISRIGGSANDRLGCVIGENYTEELFHSVSEKLLIGDNCIREISRNRSLVD